MQINKRPRGRILLGPATCDVCGGDTDILFETVTQRVPDGPYLTLRLCESCEPLDLAALEDDG